VLKLSKKHKILLFIFTLALLWMPSTNVCLANAAEPPSIIIIVTNAPEDLEVSIGEEAS
jgi:hypothetical protein